MRYSIWQTGKYRRKWLYMMIYIASNAISHYGESEKGKEQEMYQKINKNLKRPSANDLMMNILIEHIVDAIRIMPKELKGKNSLVLVQKIMEWSTYSNQEAIGYLEMLKQNYIQLALTEEEKKPKI